MPNRYAESPDRHWRRLIGAGQDVRRDPLGRARRGSCHTLPGDGREYLSAAIVEPERSGGRCVDSGRIKLHAARREP